MSNEIKTRIYIRTVSYTCCEQTGSESLCLMEDGSYEIETHVHDRHSWPVKPDEVFEMLKERIEEIDREIPSLEEDRRNAKQLMEGMKTHDPLLEARLELMYALNRKDEKCVKEKLAIAQNGMTDLEKVASLVQTALSSEDERLRWQAIEDLRNMFFP